jgi:hypothetical protein
MTTEELCEKYNIENYTIQPDGSVDVRGNVDLNKLGLKKLPIRFGVVTGWFDCLDNLLTTLEGSPVSVGDHFDCNVNQLTNLDHFPEEVGGDIYMAQNYLTSLEGLPKEVNGTLHCHYNRLTDLKGAPQKITGNFVTSNNLLTSIEGGPQTIGGEFQCSSNKLTSLEYSPLEVGRDFNIIKNYIYNLDGFDTKFGGKLLVNQNPIGLLLTDQDYECIRFFKKIKVVVDRTINLKRFKYLSGIYDLASLGDSSLIEEYYEIG